MSFIHAAFLASGLAVVVPWLLHLTRRRKYTRIRLGSLQFLEPLVRDRNRMSRIEQWPLLLARSLAVLLLALIFTRPFFQKPAPQPPVAGEILILLDASGSISANQADMIRTQVAKTIAALPKTTRPVIAEMADRVEILGSLNDYHPIPGASGNFAKAVDWIVDRSASAPDSLAAVHWFTDLQRAPLPAAPSRLWPSGLNVEIHAVLPPTDQNVAVEQIDLLTPFGGDHWEIEARVRVFGMPGNHPLELALTTADGKQLTANLPAEGGSVKFSWEGETKAGLLTGDVAVLHAGDSWPADDKRAFAFPTTQPKRIALVDGDPGESPFLSETYFLEKALHASAAGKALSPFRATVMHEIPTEAEHFDAIALCNVAGIAGPEARLLANHLKNGTGLAYFLGDQVEPAAWADVATSGIFPKGLRALPKPAPAFLRRADLSHPSLAAITPEAARGLTLLALTRRFTWPADAEWTNSMGFDEAAPFLTFSNSRKIVVVAHPANRQGSDLPLDPAFVPFVQGIFGYLAKPREADPAAAAVASLTPGMDEQRATGFYEKAPGTTLITADTTESDIASADEKTFRQVLGLPATDAPPVAAIPLADAAVSSHQREGELWPWIVAALLALLTVESGLAARRIRQPATTEAHAD